MRRLFPSLFLLCLWPAMAFGQSVTLPATAQGEPGLPLLVTATTDGANVVWLTPDKGIVVISGTTLGGDSKKALVFANAPGVYRLWALSAKGDRVSELAECKITFGKPGPVPPDPGPGPDPKPPPPNPDNPAPIPAAGLRVLIVYESADATKMPVGQQGILYGKTFRDYVTAKCVKGPDGKTAEFRIWDKDTATAGESKLWQDALAKFNAKGTPYLVVSNGKTGWEGPLPATVDAALALVKKFEN